MNDRGVSVGVMARQTRGNPIYRRATDARECNGFKDEYVPYTPALPGNC